MTTEIPLTKGFAAVVDDVDSHLANTKWYTAIGPTGIIYARRNARREDGSRFTALLHRAVLDLQPGDLSFVDHVNGNGLDCRRANLRTVSRNENARNVVGPSNGSRSPFLGVSRHGSKWQAYIKTDGSLKYLGLFATAEEANLARLAFEKSAWGIQPRRREAFDLAGLS